MSKSKIDKLSKEDRQDLVKEIVKEMGIFKDVAEIRPRAIEETIEMIGLTRHRFVSYQIAGGSDMTSIKGLDHYLKFLFELLQEKYDVIADVELKKEIRITSDGV